jgi:1-acyl-sn-glycerol-3-phosphate acyltransferase
MKTTVRVKSFDEAIKRVEKSHKKPIKPLFVMQTLIRVLSFFTLLPLGFKYTKKNMDKVSKKQPCLYLMNHSAFVDLQIASTILWPKRYSIIMTSDGFVGKKWLMRSLGCIPTNKFVSDLNLVRDMVYATRKLKSSVLMYPEAGYSLDGTATLLPDSLGKCVKLLGVPLVMIRAYGAFARQPLYNDLHRRQVRVDAEMEYLLSPEEIKQKSADEIEALICEQFSFDNFRWQEENHVSITEGDRADHLERLLYRCPVCHGEGCLEGKGTTLRCKSCGKVWELEESGFIRATEGETEYPHIPDWFAWERECVRKEIIENRYALEVDVDIYVLCDTKCLYHVGEGHLSHSLGGFRLTGCEGKLDYVQDALFSYSLNSDFNWYEIGDVIGIGTNAMLYYCIPKDKSVSVAKARLAAEEIYKMLDAQRKKVLKK